MNKKTVIFLLAGVLIFGAGLFIFFRLQSSPDLINPLVEKRGFDQSGQEVQFNWIEWQDPAGFSFEYPQGFEIDPHPEDEANYAYLEITWEGKDGRIIILCNDSQYDDIDQWLKEDEVASSGSGLETEVASLAARKVALSGGREIIGFIDQDEVLYTIDKRPENESFWPQVYKHLLSSFKLIPLEGESEAEFQDWLQGFDTAGVDVIESVEVIE